MRINPEKQGNMKIERNQQTSVILLL